MSARRSSALSRIPAPLLVFIGGGVGSLCRIYTPSYIYVANMLGAFALGVLTAWWSRRAARYGDEAVRPQRLLFGTGLLGGYTTYAALIAALNIFDEHNGTGDALMAHLVGAVMLVCVAGLAASGAGLWVGSKIPSAPGGRQRI